MGREVEAAAIEDSLERKKRCISQGGAQSSSSGVSREEHEELEKKVAALGSGVSEMANAIQAAVSGVMDSKFKEFGVLVRQQAESNDKRFKEIESEIGSVAESHEKTRREQLEMRTQIKELQAHMFLVDK